MDSLERLLGIYIAFLQFFSFFFSLEYVPIGPRFSNVVLQTLLTCFSKVPPKGRRLLVIATTSRRSMLDSMDFADVFNAEIGVPNIGDISGVLAIVKVTFSFHSIYLCDRLQRTLTQIKSIPYKN